MTATSGTTSRRGRRSGMRARIMTVYVPERTPRRSRRGKRPSGQAANLEVSALRGARRLDPRRTKTGLGRGSDRNVASYPRWRSRTPTRSVAMPRVHPLSPKIRRRAPLAVLPAALLGAMAVAVPAMADPENQTLDFNTPGAIATIGDTGFDTALGGAGAFEPGKLTLD